MIFAVLAAGAFGVRADGKSSALLGRIMTALAAYGDYEVLFTVSAEGMEDIEGGYTVSGASYRIDVGSEVHISDGASRWEISHGNREVVIDRADMGGSNVFTNPSRAFEFAEDQFDSRWAGSIIRADGKCDIIELKPAGQAYVNMSVTLYVDRTTGLPSAVEYDSDGQRVSIAITAIRDLDAADSSLFSFDRTEYIDYEIIDFR